MQEAPLPEGQRSRLSHSHIWRALRRHLFKEPKGQGHHFPTLREHARGPSFRRLKGQGHHFSIFGGHLGGTSCRRPNVKFITFPYWEVNQEAPLLGGQRSRSSLLHIVRSIRRCLFQEFKGQGHALSHIERTFRRCLFQELKGQGQHFPICKDTQGGTNVPLFTEPLFYCKWDEGFLML